MSSIGPQLPDSDSLKRKHSEGDNNSRSNGYDSESETGPELPNHNENPSKRPRVIGPSLPAAIEQLNTSHTTYKTHPDKNPSNNTAKVISGNKDHEDGREDDDGNDGNDDSDDDDFGPSLPPTGGAVKSIISESMSSAAARSTHETSVPSKRDDWMMVPPSGGDWSARIDPTKLKNRKFNTGKGAKAPTSTGDASTTWHETPVEKQARLQREMMGIKDNSTKAGPVKEDGTEKSDTETAKRLAEYNKSRGPSLYSSHQTTQTEKDDDPSAREFDREKDIGGGLQINATKRKEMLKTASNLGSRFGSAKYL